jgi:hypothetical protein
MGPDFWIGATTRNNEVPGKEPRRKRRQNNKITKRGGPIIALCTRMLSRVKIGHKSLILCCACSICIAVSARLHAVANSYGKEELRRTRREQVLGTSVTNSSNTGVFGDVDLRKEKDRAVP